MDHASQQSRRANALSDESEARASVHLTRFTIHPGRRAELVEAARSVASSAEFHERAHWELLVELEDGDWLQISITGPELDPDDAPVYFDLVTGVLGDEDGAVVCCTCVDGECAAAPRGQTPRQESSELTPEARTDTGALRVSERGGGK